MKKYLLFLGFSCLVLAKCSHAQDSAKLKRHDHLVDSVKRDNLKKRGRVYLIINGHWQRVDTIRHWHNDTLYNRKYHKH